MALQKRVVEENIKRHSFFGITTQQAKEKVLQFWSCTNRNPKRSFNNVRSCYQKMLLKLTLGPSLRSSHRNFSALVVCELGMEPFPSNTETQSFRVTRDLKQHKREVKQLLRAIEATCLTYQLSHHTVET